MTVQCLFPIATSSSHEWWQKSEPCSSYSLSWYFISSLSIITVLYKAISYHPDEFWENDFVLRSNIIFCFYNAQLCCCCTGIWGHCFFLLSSAIICCFWTKPIQMPFACVINSMGARRNKLGFSGVLTKQLKSQVKIQINVCSLILKTFVLCRNLCWFCTKRDEIKKQFAVLKSTALFWKKILMCL